MELDKYGGVGWSSLVVS